MSRRIVRTPLDRVRAGQLAEEGQQRALMHASEENKELLRDAILWVAANHDHPSSDLVWEHLGWIPDHALASALGPLMKEGVRAGWLIRSGTTETARPAQHRRVIREWTSLIGPSARAGTLVIRCGECHRPLDEQPTLPDPQQAATDFTMRTPRSTPAVKNPATENARRRSKPTRGASSTGTGRTTEEIERARDRIAARNAAAANTA